MAEKSPRTEWSESEMDTEGGGEAGSSQFQSRCENRHMTNIYLTDPDEEAILDLGHLELYDKTNKHFKDKVRKDCLSEKFTSNVNLRLGLNPKEVGMDC